MRRREFLASLIGAASVWPVPARTQQNKPVIGFLNGGSMEGYAPYVAAFREGLRQSGYVEGENVVIEYRWAEGRYNLLRDLVADLVKRNVAVIVANTPANLEAKKATDTIPLVFTTGSDPVQIGLVSNLRRPGGNVTGVSQLGALLGPKRLELAHELFPNATDAPFMINPTDSVRAEKLLIAPQIARWYDSCSMCNLYSITTNQAAIIALFRVINRYVGNLPPMTGVFPDYPAPVIRNTDTGRELAMMRWGMPAANAGSRNVLLNRSCRDGRKAALVPDTGSIRRRQDREGLL